MTREIVTKDLSDDIRETCLGRFYDEAGYADRVRGARRVKPEGGVRNPIVSELCGRVAANTIQRGRSFIGEALQVAMGGDPRNPNVL